MGASISHPRTRDSSPIAARAAVEATAAAYDVLTADHDYEAWTALIASLAHRHGLPERGRLLDVGCGTGKSFLPWLARGWSVVGCDFSAAMLARARAKAPEVELLERDARALGDLGRFELVLALDDVVNLLPAVDHPDLFGGVERNLAPCGLFVFDLNTLHTFRTAFATTHVAESDGCVVVWSGRAEATFGPGDAADAVMEAFVRDDDDGRWRRRRGVHREHHHPLGRVERALGAAGLELVAAYGQDPACNVDPRPDELAHSKLLVIARRARPRR